MLQYITDSTANRGYSAFYNYKIGDLQAITVLIGVALDSSLYYWELYFYFLLASSNIDSIKRHLKNKKSLLTCRDENDNIKSDFL